MKAPHADRSLALSPATRVFRRLRGQLFIDRADPKATVFLAGSPRSGTTWLAETLTIRQRMRLVFEPFHPSEVGLATAFDHRQYVRPASRDPRYLEPAERIISGRIRSSWTDRMNRALLPHRRLIKEVRANLMLGWLHSRFPFMPIILLLRHPGAVVASQRSVMWDFNTETSRLLAQPDLVDDYLGPYVSLIQDAEPGLEQGVLMWSIENFVPLQQFRRGEIHIVCYEHLLSRPEEEFRRLLTHCGLPFQPGLLASVDRPSAVTAKVSPLVRGGDPISDWQARIEPADRDRIASLLAQFGLDRLYGPDSMPRLEDPNELLRADAA